MSIHTHVAVWPSSCYDPQAGVFGSIEEELEVLARRFEIVYVLGWGVVRPEEVDAAA